MYTQKSFYKSDAWEKFRTIIIAERTDQKDGFVRCALCGQPIVKKYDLIVHHINELDDITCNDATIALNPENVECVHFQCHNKIHKRFGFGTGGYKPPQKRVYIIYGAPLSGKSSWVKAAANDDDLIIDLDNIWEMISTNERYKKPSALRSVVFDIRDNLYEIVKYRRGKWVNAFVITGGALRGDRERLARMIGADDLIYIECDKDECVRRLDDREVDRDEWLKYIDEWFNSYQE